MKKKIAVMFIAIAVIALAWNVWLYAYHNQKNNDNLPGLTSIAKMDEGEINKKVCGYRRVQLNYMWKEPYKTDENEDIWSLGGDRFLQVNYNNKERAVSCDCFVELFPDRTETVKMSYSAGTALETERELTQDEISDLMDWASGLDLELPSREEGQAPNQIYAGGEEYRFDINEGEETFSYAWIENYYIYKGGEWYKVNNPSFPPI